MIELKTGRKGKERRVGGCGGLRMERGEWEAVVLVSHSFFLVAISRELGTAVPREALLSRVSPLASRS